MPLYGAMGSNIFSSLPTCGARKAPGIKFIKHPSWALKLKKYMATDLGDLGDYDFFYMH